MTDAGIAEENASNPSTSEILPEEERLVPTPFDALTSLSTVGGYSTVIPAGPAEDGSTRVALSRRVTFYEKEVIFFDREFLLTDIVFIVNALSEYINKDFDLMAKNPGLAAFGSQKSAKITFDYAEEARKNMQETVDKLQIMMNLQANAE